MNGGQFKSSIPTSEMGPITTSVIPQETQNNARAVIQNSSIPQNHTSRPTEAVPPTGSVTQGAQLSDTASDTSSDIDPANTATFPQYDFKMSATKLALFLSVFNTTKHKLEGVGFPV